MRDPLQLPATVEDRMSLTNRKHGSNHRRSDSPSLLRPTTSAELRENVIGPFIMDNSEAMTRHRHNNRNLRSITPSRLRHSAGGGVPNGGGIRNEKPRQQQQQQPNPNLLPSRNRDPSPLHSNRKFEMIRRDSNSAMSHRGDSISAVSQTSGSAALPPGATDWEWQPNLDPDDQEQALFEQRLCEDMYGVAVRKINQNGKSNLRYVKCIEIDLAELENDANNGFSSNRSVGSRSSAFSFTKGFSRFRSDRSVDRSESGKEIDRLLRPLGTMVKVLVWGKKKDVKIPLERFASVRKGKTTDRTRRNVSPSSRILSLITDDPYHPSLDIEAPTRLDRDKFARAFARFLNVPLEGDENRSSRSDLTPQSRNDRQNIIHHHDPYRNQFMSASGSNSQASNGRKNIPLPVVTTTPTREKIPPHKSSNREINVIAKAKLAQESAAMEANRKIQDNPDPQLLSLPSSFMGSSHIEIPVPTSSKQGSASAKRQSALTNSERSFPESSRLDVHATDDGSAVSSITGAAFDPEIVEELHMALAETRAELEESRAEAARAVKVAEQAIKSAENNNSKDWNSTVTQKAAEAAARAQKKSAEAMSRARLAEERLEAEQKNVSIWRKKAQAAEEEAGYWQTRAAAAEVRKAAMTESWESERNKTAVLLSSMAQRVNGVETHENDDLESVMDRNRALEIELEIMRSKLANKDDEIAALQECFAELESSPEACQVLSGKNPGLITKIKKVQNQDGTSMSMLANSMSEQEYNNQSEFSQVSQAVMASQSEIQRLRSKLAMENAVRRKLSHEVQDLRGAVRVYCRPKSATNGVCTLSVPSNEVILLHRERAGSNKDAASHSPPLSFEFDGVLTPEMDQQELYGEVEEVCLNVLDGYNVCVMAYGQSRTGKTRTMLGDVGYSITDDGEPISSINNFGVHLRAAKQIFSVLKHRSQRFKDVVSFSLLEVNDERLSDLLAGTDIGESQGFLETRKGNRRRTDSTRSVTSSTSETGNSAQATTKLEIKTNYNGETIVHGLLSVEVKSFEDICRVWKECLSLRVSRLAEQGLKLEDHDHSSHIIGTMRVYSTNLSTGVGTRGRIQFVDLAAADISPERFSGGSKRALSPEWKFNNKSISTLGEVVLARSQFQRSVPYRNSTITHLLRDSLEADTKVVMVACVSSDPEDIQETTSTLKFAQAMRKVIVGKATKHTLIES